MNSREFLFANPDGTIEGLYTDVIDLADLGTLHVERASTIEFDNKAQVWRATLNNGKQFTSTEREWCVIWERDEINRMLERKCS